MIFAAGYGFGRMAKGETLQEAITGGLSGLKRLGKAAEKAAVQAQSAGPQLVEPSGNEELGGLGYPRLGAHRGFYA